MNTLSDFIKTKDYLICVDSDGCAMDTMDVKHIVCFGPCMVTEWGLEPWRDAILARWNDINLYTLTRGINRFKGLAQALAEIHTQYIPIDGIDALTHWADTAPELSNGALEALIAAGAHPSSKKRYRGAPPSMPPFVPSPLRRFAPLSAHARHWPTPTDMRISPSSPAPTAALYWKSGNVTVCCPTPTWC